VSVRLTLRQIHAALETTRRIRGNPSLMRLMEVSWDPNRPEADRAVDQRVWIDHITQIARETGEDR
jgi:hypothetical protein